LPLVVQISGAQVHDSRLSRQSRPLKSCQAALTNVQENCTPTVPMHHERTGPGCAGEGLLLALRDTASSHVKGLAAGVGWSSEPLVGFTDSAGCESATSAAQIFIKPVFCWPARSSAGGTLNGIVRDTKGPWIGAAR
jgi:hypothetical protein